MKFALLAGLLLATVPALAQMQPPPPTKAELETKARESGLELNEPFKGANAILVHTSDSAKAALKVVAQQLQQVGFVIDRIDYDLLSVSTKPRVFTKSSLYTMTASAVVDKADIVIRGEWHGQIGVYNANEQAAYTNPASRKAFAELQAVAAAYPNGRVGYQKRR